MQNIGLKILQGSFFSVICTIASKVISFAGYAVLSWFLLPEDMGLVALTLSVIALSSILRAGGLTATLTQCSENFEKKAGQGLLLALIMNVFVAIILFTTAPLVAQIVRDIRLVPLFRFSSLIFIVQSFNVVPNSKLLRELRYNMLNALNVFRVLIDMLGAVILAWKGFGAMSLIAPRIVSEILATTATWYITKPIKIDRPNYTLLLDLFRPVMWINLLGISQTFRHNGINFILGIMKGTAVTGIFFWGYNLSNQIVYTLSQNLNMVLFPSLAKVNYDSVRLYNGFTIIVRSMVLLIAPLCVLQALLAFQIIEIFFHKRWLTAAPVMFWMSLGLILQPISIVSQSVLMARAQFKKLTIINSFLVGFLLIGVITGAFIGKAREIAIIYSIINTSGNFIIGWITIQEFNNSIYKYTSIFLFPVFASALSGCIGCIVLQLLFNYSSFFKVIITSLIFTIIYILLLRIIWKKHIYSLIKRLIDATKHKKSDVSVLETV